MGEMDAAIQEFLVESDENLSQVERDLVDFEGHPEQQETLASIFSASHTITGTQIVLATNQDQPENSCRPAVDVIFRFVTKVYGDAVLAVVLTGMGHNVMGCLEPKWFGKLVVR